jgi:hypothetical protein
MPLSIIFPFLRSAKHHLPIIGIELHPAPDFICCHTSEGNEATSDLTKGELVISPVTAALLLSDSHSPAFPIRSHLSSSPRSLPFPLSSHHHPSPPPFRCEFSQPKYLSRSTRFTRQEGRSCPRRPAITGPPISRPPARPSSRVPKPWW